MVRESEAFEEALKSAEQVFLRKNRAGHVANVLLSVLVGAAVGIANAYQACTPNAIEQLGGSCFINDSSIWFSPGFLGLAVATLVFTLLTHLTFDARRLVYATPFLPVKLVMLFIGYVAAVVVAGHMSYIAFAFGYDITLQPDDDERRNYYGTLSGTLSVMLMTIGAAHINWALYNAYAKVKTLHQQTFEILENNKTSDLVLTTAGVLQVMPLLVFGEFPTKGSFSISGLLCLFWVGSFIRLQGRLKRARLAPMTQSSPAPEREQ